MNNSPGSADSRPWVAIQRNRASGAGQQYRAIVDLVAELKAFGIRPRLFGSRSALDAELQRRGTDTLLGLVAAGGDGTVLDVVNRHPGIAVAILPLGTENLIARHFLIPARDGRGVARMIVRGKVTSLDLGRAGERRFTVMASCGFDADVIHRVHRARTGHITRRHYHRPIWRALREFPFHPIRVQVDDVTLTGQLAVIANLPQYALGLSVVPDADPHDGLLDVRVFEHESAFQLLRDFGNVLLRQPSREDGVRVRGSRVWIEAESPVPVQADGDPAGATPIEITIEPGAARLFVP